jgi:hypothetical protein
MMSFTLLVVKFEGVMSFLIFGCLMTQSWASGGPNPLEIP